MGLTFQQKKRMRRALIGTTVLAVAFVAMQALPFFRRVADRLEQVTLDYRYVRFNPHPHTPDQVVEIDIDEQSMKLLGPSYGRWPWPRRIYKEMIEFLAMGEPAAILFDVLFTEGQQGTEDDKLLAETTASVGMVSHAMLLLADPAEEREGDLSLPEGFAARYGLKWSQPPGPWFTHRKFRDYLLPASEYMKVIPKIHSVTTEPDRDGVFRHAPIFFQYGEAWIPSLPMLGILSTLKNPVLSAHPGGLSIESEGKILQVPLSQQGLLSLNFYPPDPEKGLKTIPIAAIIGSALQLQKGEVQDPSQLKVNPFSFKGKVILVGASAAGAADLKPTPVHPSFPGVLLHATAITNVLNQDFLYRIPLVWRLLIGLLILTTTYYSVLILEHIVLKVSLPLALMGILNGIALWLFQRNNVWVDMAMPTVVGLTAMFDGLAYISFVENAEKKKISSTLSKYLSPAVSAQLIGSGSDPRAEVGRFEELSVLFSDIRGFTTMSEMFKPEVLVQHLNEYLGRMTDVIFDNTGTLDKFIGDAVMAFWGAPLRDEEHALKSVKCGFAMQKALLGLKENWKTRTASGININIGVGINTGPVIVGNIGSEKRLDYTVIGDNVNLASRIEGLTKQYHSTFLIGPQTQISVEKSVICRPIDLVQVKGRAHHVRIWEPLCMVQDSDAVKMRELVERFELGWNHYQKGNFADALKEFERTHQWRAGGDGPSEVYIERCKDLIAEPPQDWSGVYVAKSK